MTQVELSIAECRRLCWHPPVGFAKRHPEIQLWLDRKGTRCERLVKTTRDGSILSICPPVSTTKVARRRPNLAPRDIQLPIWLCSTCLFLQALAAHRLPHSPPPSAKPTTGLGTSGRADRSFADAPRIRRVQTFETFAGDHKAKLLLQYHAAARKQTEEYVPRENNPALLKRLPQISVLCYPCRGKPSGPASCKRHASSASPCLGV